MASSVGTVYADFALEKGQVGRAVKDAVSTEGQPAVKDSFQGLAKSAAGYFAGTFLAFKAATKVADFFKDSVNEARESIKVGNLTEQVLKSTGGAANVSAGQIGDYADSLSKVTGVDDEVIQSAENVLLTFTKVRNQAGAGNDIFKQGITVAEDLSAALGQDLQSSVIQVGKALNDPIKGVTALQRVGVSFTQSQRDQIKTLAETGHTLEAQKLILKELQTEFGGAAAAAADPAQKLGVAWKNFEEQIGLALLPMLNGLFTALGFVLGVVQKIPGPVLVAGGALLTLGAGILLVGRAITIWSSIRRTIDTVIEGFQTARAGVGALRQAISEMSWGQIAVGGAVIAGVAIAFKLMEDALARNRKAAKDWADTFVKSIGGVSDKTLPQIQKAVTDLNTVSNRGWHLSIAGIELYTDTTAKKAAEQRDALNNLGLAYVDAAKKSGKSFADQALAAGASEETIGQVAADLQKKWQAAGDAVRSAFAGLGPAAATAELLAQDATKSADDLNKVAKAVNDVKEAYGGLAPTSVQALAAMVAQGQLTADQLSNIANQAKQLRDGMASSFGSATSIVQAFGGEAKVTFDQINKFFADQVAAARNWAGNLKALVSAGVDQGLIAELAQAGPKAAPLVAGLLDDVKRGNLGTINQAQADLRQILTDTQGTILGYETPFFVAGQTDGQGLTAGLAGGVGGAQAALQAALQAAVDAARILDYFRGLGNAAGRIFAGGVSEAIQANVVTSFTGTGGGRQSLGSVIAHHASGGVVTGPQISWLAEDGPEVVIPLNDRVRAMQLAAESGLTDMLSGASGGSTAAGAGGGGTVLENRLFIDGREVNVATAPSRSGADRTYRRSRQ